MTNKLLYTSLQDCKIKKGNSVCTSSLHSLGNGVGKYLLTLCLLMASVGAWAQQYVFISNETNGYFLNNAATATQTFDENTCVWTAGATMGGTSTTLCIGTTYLRGRGANDANNARTGDNGSRYISQWRSVNNYLVHYYSANRYVYRNNSNQAYWNDNTTRPNAAFGVYSSYTNTPAALSVDAITGINNAVTTTGTYNLTSAASYSPTHYTFTGGPDTRYYTSSTGYSTGAVTTKPTKTTGFTTDKWEISPNNIPGLSLVGTQLRYTQQPLYDTQVTITHTVSEAGLTETATRTITLQGATPSAPTITPGPGTNQYTISVPANSTVRYTLDGTEPTASHGTSISATTTITVTTPNTTIKAKAVRGGVLSEETDYTIATVTLAAPTITISDAGSVTITNPNGVGTIHYTTDGSEPTASSATYSSAFTVGNMATVKAIITGGVGYTPSAVASQQYKIPSGVSGGVVTLNDYEDHNWSYYSDPESPVKNLDPINVKITYNGGGVNNASAVAVSRTESANTFVYYKTIEKGTTIESVGFVDEYSYYTIPNPFSKRPRTNGSTGTNGYFGFNGWRITRIVGGSVTIGGNTYNAGENLTINVAADTKIIFKPTTQTINGTDMEIEMTAQWAAASVVTCTAANLNANLNSDNLTRGTYERNFIVVTSGNSGTALTAGTSKPVTITMVTPDGATDYRANGVYINPATITLSNDWKFEYFNMRDNSTVLNANCKNLVLGRGIARDDGGTGYCISEIHGFYATASKTFSNPKYRIRIESGVYNNIYFTNGQGGASNTIRSYAVGNGTLDLDAVMGCDFDRANSTNTSLRTNNPVYMGDAYEAFNNTTNNRSVNDKRETFRLYIKSGDIGYGIANSENTYAMEATVYIAHKAHGNAGYLGRRVMVVEGGIICAICGGRDATVGNNTGNTHYMANLVRMKGGIVRGPVYLGAANAAAYNDRYFIMTGGHVKGWVAGGCNGNTYSNGGGKTIGESFMYIGGNARVAGDELTNTIGDCARGVLMGAGDGRTSYAATATCGELTYGTNVVVADQCYIARDVYGGGNYGYSKAASHLFISGGTVKGSVFGGANNREGVDVTIHMKDGTVEGGIYGGSNAKGTISQNVTMQIDGGQVGEPGAPGNIHGGGYGEGTIVSGNVEMTLGNLADERGAKIYGNVYGGSALGTTGGNTRHTYVTVNRGTITGNVFGGGMGEAGSNTKGVVTGTIKVDVYGTDPKPTDDTYALFGVYGGGDLAPYAGTPLVTVHNCDNSIEYVYGGGNATSVGATDVTIYGGNKIGNVFGGGNGQVKAANVNGNTNVKIYGGTIGDVYGGSNTNGTIGGTISVNVNAQAEDGHDACPVNIDNVYGGGNKAASNAGQITIGKCFNISNVYGGANQANVTGPINLNIVDGNIGTVFGGNNNSGTVTGAINVTVNWNGTDDRSLGSVYGGGNLASYTGNPTVNIINCETTGSVFGGGLGKSAVVVGNPTVNIGSWTAGSVVIGGDVFGGGDLAAVEGNPTVVIKDCETIITGDLYGGGNAAPVYSTNTTMWGGSVWGNAFGGGNGADPTKNANGAQVGYKSDDTTKAGSGDATMNIYGGTIGVWNGDECTAGGGIFGGSNTNGNIAGHVNLTIDQRKDGTYGCDLKLKELYGAGNQAAYTGTGIKFDLGCVDYLEEIYGGAKAADLNSNAVLTIRSGHFKNVFGGNNERGKLNGKIVVNIDETGCNPIIIENLYGGGNQAAYSVYGYETELNMDKSVKVKTTGEKLYDDPQVNIISCTRIDNVFGGGYGATAVMVGSPTVNINQIPGDHASAIDGNLGAIGIVYGGGNEAKVVGDTNVNIGTATTKVKHISGDDTTTEYDASAYITGNVYGGGNAADVTGKTNVTVGKE